LKEGGTGSAWRWGWGGVAEGDGQTMYTHISKCKNDKMKFKKETGLKVRVLPKPEIPAT
jgi:hypothetical protein